MKRSANACGAESVALYRAPLDRQRKHPKWAASPAKVGGLVLNGEALPRLTAREVRVTAAA